MHPTQMTNISDLLPYILPRASTAPDFLALFHARLAVIEFCERTRCWRQIITKQVGSNGRVRVAPIGATIHEFEEAYLGENKLDPTQFTEAEPDELTGLSTTGAAKYISQITPGEAMVLPIQTGTLRVSCFLKPLHGVQMGDNAADPLEDANNVMPAFMVSQYAEKLAHGALYRIVSVPKQDFTDLDMAAVHKKAFDDACDRHFSSNIRGQQRTPLRTKARFL